MNTLILYATKYGATREIAKAISDRLGGAALHDLKQGRTPDLTEFDCIIIGSSLYAGSIRKEAKAFLSQHANTLQQKQIGLFLSGMAPADEAKYFAENFPKDLLQATRAAYFLGGIFDPQKTSGAERFIMKLAAKQSEYANTIDDEKIEQYAALMDV